VLVGERKVGGSCLMLQEMSRHGGEWLLFSARCKSGKKRTAEKTSGESRLDALYEDTLLRVNKILLCFTRGIA
jgi:hypothetical protein